MEKERDISKLFRGAFNLLSVQAHLRWEGKKLKFGLIKKLSSKLKQTKASSSPAPPEATSTSAGCESLPQARSHPHHTDQSSSPLQCHHTPQHHGNKHGIFSRECQPAEHCGEATLSCRYSWRFHLLGSWTASWGSLRMVLLSAGVQKPTGCVGGKTPETQPEQG